MRALLTASIALALASSAGVARADVKACVAAHEKGQQSRSAGRLGEARESFLVCAADSCPGAVRRDCVRWLEDVTSRMPTVVIGAKDRGGRDVLDVKVTVDGAPLVDKLDGKSIAVDPGAHTFRFEAAGMPPVTQKILVKEGERARPIDIVFEGGEPPPADNGGGKASDAKTGDKADATTEKHGPGILPWVLVGVGGVAAVGGVVYALTAPPLPAGCDGARQTCTQFEGESRESFDSRRDQAGKHDTQSTTGFIIAAGGGVLLAGGLVWYLVGSSGSSSPKKASTPLVVPWVSAGGGGAVATARF